MLHFICLQTWVWCYFNVLKAVTSLRSRLLLSIRAFIYPPSLRKKMTDTQLVYCRCNCSKVEYTIHRICIDKTYHTVIHLLESVIKPLNDWDEIVYVALEASTLIICWWWTNQSIIMQIIWTWYGVGVEELGKVGCFRCLTSTLVKSFVPFWLKNYLGVLFCPHPCTLPADMVWRLVSLACKSAHTRETDNSSKFARSNTVCENKKGWNRSSQLLSLLYNHRKTLFRIISVA